MRSEGFSFYILGVWGRCVRWKPLTGVRNRLQLFATVCERPSWQKVALPMGSSARGVTFGGFQRCVLVTSGRVW